ncbi:MAG TPA: nitroreductase [Acidimicrobiaceae bacterium]|nr:nitroreductase [Acidimicrobiaceae bacterium]HCB37179.1 nitroreductase [Acidimicrobiaceae bacterium]
MTGRSSDAPALDDVFLRRWSPRSWSDEPVSDDELRTLFEAARWTPSWFNSQPWHYLYADGGPDREALLGVLMDGNRTWARNAPVVGLVIARTGLEGFMARSRDFDTGAATMALIIQATMLGLSVHLMGGIEVDAAHELTGIDPEVAKIVCGFVVGRRGDGSDLDEALAGREHPSDRKPVAEFAFRATQLPAGLFD